MTDVTPDNPPAAGAGDPSAPATGPDPSPRPAPRCFGDGDPLYAAYHDEEWGVPVHGERELYERVALKSFQSGLSWITILRKREAFRAAFGGFDPEAVAAFGEDDIVRLLADAGIVRNRAKIEATIANARGGRQGDASMFRQAMAVGVFRVR